MTKQIILWLTIALIGAGALTSFVMAQKDEGFEDGSVIKIKGESTIYLIEEGVKRPFVDTETYKAFGYSWYDVKTVNADEVKDFEIGPVVKTPTVIIKADTLFVRKWPNSFSKVLATVQKDEKYELVDNSGSWYKIKGGDELLGWIPSRYAMILDEEMNEFVAAKEEETKKEEVKTEEVKTETKAEEPVVEETAPTKSLTLTYLGNGKFSWKKVGTFSQGYKLVWSKNTAPTYPLRDGDQYAFYSEPETSVGYVSAFAGEGKYYVRVCEYLGGKCGIYSNQVAITLLGDKEEPEETPQAVTSITLTALNGGHISWKVNGYSKNGFKVVWSQNPTPVYPTRDDDQYHYYSEPTKTTDTVDNFSGEGKYYVRVCEYLGGVCGKYSNQVEVNL